MYKVILASASPRRREILSQIGTVFEVMVSDLEENMEDENPEHMVMELAAQKAEDVAKRVSAPAVIIGADTIVWHKKKALGKPKDRADAVRMIMELQGNKHMVYTGVKLIIKEKNKERTDSFAAGTVVWVREVTKEAAEAYADTKEPMDKAGAYAIQGRFAPYIEKIEGDYYNVVGLPVSEIYHRLLGMGVDLLE